MFKNLSLRIKLSLIFSLSAVMVGAVSFMQIQSINHIHDLFGKIVSNDLARSTVLHELRSLSNDLEQLALQHSLGLAPQNTNLAAAQAANTQLEQQIAAYEKLQSTAAAKKDFGLIAKAVRTVASEALPLVDQPVTTKKTAALAQLDTAQNSAETLINQSLITEQAVIAARTTEVNDTIAQSQLITTLTALLTTFVAIALGVFASTRLANQLSKLRVGAQRMANGDFSEMVTVISQDEIGQLATTFNQMSARLKDSYQRLALEKQRDDAILENMGDGLIAVNEAAEIVLANSIGAELLELGEESQAIGKELYKVIKLYDQSKKLLNTRQTPAYATLHYAQVVNDVYSFHRQDGQQILLNISSTPILLDEKVVGAIIVLRDVTKEREIDRMKTEFISLASHQLRTPLSAIKWFSEMLLSGDAGKLKGDQVEFTKSIADSTERMIQLVNALLNISRIESGRIMVDPKPTDLKELVGGIVNDLKAKTEERQQTLIISVHSDLPKIKLDPRLIGQVYLNLLTNAIKYTPKGGEISVFISKKGSDVISQVTDNGYGIPKEQQDRVFQKFFRAANAVKIETDGTGLGLYLIKAVIESSGGKIWFKSEEGKGTTFWFSIPLSGMKAKAGEVTLDV